MCSGKRLAAGTSPQTPSSGGSCRPPHPLLGEGLGKEGERRGKGRRGRGRGGNGSGKEGRRGEGRGIVTMAPGRAVATAGINSKVDVCEKAKHHTELFW